MKSLFGTDDIKRTDGEWGEETCRGTLGPPDGAVPIAKRSLDLILSG